MPRYFLNLRYRPGPLGVAIDDEGDELAEEGLLHDHVLGVARDLAARTHLEMIRNWYDCSFEVTDEAGFRVLTLPFAELVEPRLD